MRNARQSAGLFSQGPLLAPPHPTNSHTVGNHSEGFNRKDPQGKEVESIAMVRGKAHRNGLSWRIMVGMCSLGLLEEEFGV